MTEGPGAAPGSPALDTMAVVVGIETYDTGGKWRLDGPALDACRFAEWLRTCGVPDERITLFVSPLPENEEAVRSASCGLSTAPATSTQVQEFLTRTLPKSSSGLLIVYWGGHGVMEDEERRLLYEDATSADKRNLNLTALLRSMRSTTYARHPRQLVLVDACSSLVEELKWEGRLPDVRVAEGRREPQRDQRVLLAASPGERARNVDVLKTGLFSSVLREELAGLPPGTWPPDADELRDVVRERFESLRDQGRTQQVPSHLWFRSRSDERDDLVFTADPATGRPPSHGELLSHPEFRSLKRVLDGAPAPARLRDLYRDATRDVVGCVAPRHPDDLLSTVRALRGAVSAMPLFRFLVRFAADSDSVTADQLWEWVNESGPRWGVDMDELRDLADQLCRRHLVIRLVPDLLDERLQVTGWTFEGRQGQQTLCTDDEPWDRARLSTELGTLVGGYDPASHLTAPVVEFLVGLPMLDDALESLPVRLAGQDLEIGTACPVVIRPLERLSDPRAQDSLRVKWKDLRMRGETYDEEAIHWVERAPDHAADNELMRARVCTALAYARTAGPHQDAALLAALDAGTPVALWHRSSENRASRRTDLESVLRNRGLLELPDVVLGQRVAARHPQARPDHSGRDLVLLWDDPDRIPAELEWRPPALSGAPQ